ncbi:MAG TPA: precorrin-6A reductase [Tissierellaceae bacterium]|jgi:precorrin-6A/cobalt-precorrin-6A reductase|nr:precorrin-6A reductase [Tissierellaceae bacterium]
MIWVIGGTSEAREFINLFENREILIVTVATEDGRRVLSGANIITGRLDFQSMIHFIREHRIRILVDLSHPYAIEVSNNAEMAAAAEGIPYLGFSRGKTEWFKEAIYLDSFDSCLEKVREMEGTFFFTTGVKTLPDFEKIRGSNRFVHRIIPSQESLGICLDNKVGLNNIVALLGPFSRELNRELFKEYEVDYVVMKDSGIRGGTKEKLLACRDLGIVPLVIGRQEKEGYTDLVKMKLETIGYYKE